MTVGVKMEGLPELKAHLDRMTPELERTASAAVYASAQEIRTDIITSIQQGARTGRIYPRGGGKTHQASAPGEPPKSDTGALINSVTFTEMNADGTIGASFGTTLVYAHALEFGTRASLGGERPAWRPAIKRGEPRFEKMIENAIKVAFKLGGSR